jgi:hypothetical protein
MRINFAGQTTSGLVRLSLIGFVLLIFLAFSRSSDYAGVQNQPKEENTIMQNSGRNLSPLDLQIPAKTETATFAMG